MVSKKPELLFERGLIDLHALGAMPNFQFSEPTLKLLAPSKWNFKRQKNNQSMPKDCTTEYHSSYQTKRLKLYEKDDMILDYYQKT